MSAAESRTGGLSWWAGGGPGGTRSAPGGWPARRGAGEADEALARFLGWFSVGLGLTQVLAPRGFARFVGASGGADSRATVRLVGLRELTCGAALLAGADRARWLWARAAGDAIDLALLGKLMAGSDEPGRVSAATLGVVGAAALDVFAALRHSPGA